MATTETKQERSPVIAILGHIDHGKSALLDYIQKSNIVEGEAGGITQHLSAYEIEHKDSSGNTKSLTFIDTPGHEAFVAQRARGTHAADIAILIVSAEEGVKQQTKEALKTIKESGVPFVIAINKIDKPNANVEKVLNELTENEIYVEGRGGSVSYVPISAKTGEGVDDLLEVLLLAVEIEELTGNRDLLATGVVIEAYRDPKKGIVSTLVIKDGSLSKGSFIGAPGGVTPIRHIESTVGENLNEASFSSPIRVVGWNTIPEIGSTFSVFKSKKEAETYSKIKPNTVAPSTQAANDIKDEDTVVIPIILKADVAGTIGALQHEIEKIEAEKVHIKIIRSAVGSISETDLKAAGGDGDTIILGFNTKIDKNVPEMAARNGIIVKTFDIIYKLTEWLEEAVEKRRPRIATEEVRGSLKILRLFSSTKTKQVIGGKVTLGALKTGDSVKIKRRENEIGVGTIVELQAQRAVVKEVQEGSECGMNIATKVALATGDELEATTVTHT